MTIAKFTDLLYGCHILGVWMDWVLMIKYRCNSPPEIVCRPYSEVWGRYEILRGVTADRPFFFWDQFIFRGICKTDRTCEPSEWNCVDIQSRILGQFGTERLGNLVRVI